MNSQKSFLLYFLLIFSIGCERELLLDDIQLPEISIENKPGTYWWWMGSAVDEENIKYNLKNFGDVGIGTVHIVPIYGVKGEEKRYIDFLSPEWIYMLKFTLEEAAKLNLNVDMSTTTGWPFGGSHVTPEYAASKLDIKIFETADNKIFSSRLKLDDLVTVAAYDEDNTKIILTDEIDNEGNLNWDVPKGNWKIFVLSKIGTGQMVKRAAPGNEGLVLDPFSVNALKFYLSRYDTAFQDFKVTPNFRAQYHDSYEYYHANWTDNLFHYFKSKNDYDLMDYLPNLFGDLSDEKTIRIKADYRKTISDLHLEYIEWWSDWSHEKGWLTRNEGHGAPANLLDLYAASDIPETETFGSRKYKVPGINFERNENSNSEPPNPLILKFASSATNIKGTTLVSCETATWLRDHFKTSLSQVKPEIDELFYSGINHLFYHGSAYSPEEADWPGWLFYASTHFEKENSIWKDFPALNKYVTNCQNILQSARSDNDILLYWPIDDLFHRYPDNLIKTFNVHHTDWFENSSFGELAKMLDSNGYSFDYISDKQIEDLQVINNKINSNGNSYSIILIPQVDYIPITTFQDLINLAQSGAHIIFYNSLPNDISGFANFFENRLLFEQLKANLNLLNDQASGIHISEVGKGKFIISNKLSETLRHLNIRNENFSNKDLHFIRKLHEHGNYYFLTNLSDEEINNWVALAAEFKSAAIINPMNLNDRGVAEQRRDKSNSQIYLQLKPGQSCFIMTFNSEILVGEKWPYFDNASGKIELNGNWEIEFIDGGPVLPEDVITDSLISWTDLKDESARKFAGTARYSLEFTLPDVDCDEWLLNLGNVRESAKLFVNGKFVETLWSIPQEAYIGKYLKDGDNLLEVEVTNLSANRIRDLDIKGVDWKKFFFVNIFYKDFDASQWKLKDSGLMGPVTLSPLKIMKLTNN